MIVCPNLLVVPTKTLGLGVGLRSTKKAERCKRARMVKNINGRDVIVEPLNAWARLLVGQCGEPRGSGVSGRWGSRRNYRGKSRCSAS
ncbi:MAG: hypothetical protein LM590_01210 [Thermofilum sp.]|nr:hypothetical protein [Thermofilum sp.]